MATLEPYDLDRGADETFDFLCSVCKRKNRKTEADTFCSDCQDYYCKTCVKVHEDVPALLSHKILDKSQFQSGTSASFPAVPTERCGEHGQKPVDMYCQQHDVVGCSNCMVIKHSDCKDKFYVPEYVSKSKLPDTTSITRALDSISKKLQQLQQKFANDQEKLKNNNDIILEMIHEFREEINQRLDDLEQNTIRLAEQKFQAMRDDIETKLQELQTSYSEVQIALENLQSTVENVPQLFVSAHKATEITSRANRTLQSLLDSSQDFTVYVLFTKNQKLSSLLNKIQILGEIYTDKIIKSLPDQDKAPPSQQRSDDDDDAGDKQQESSKEQPPAVNVTSKQTYSVRMKSDKRTCSIISACELEDGTIIIADQANQQLKRLDRSKYHVKDGCDLSMKPWQVCVTAHQEVAVSCRLTCLIQFVTVGRKMVKTRQISTGFSCYGMAYADGKLYVSDSFTAVYVYTVAGEKLQQFSKDQHGNNLFSTIQSLAVNSYNSRIYVADCNRGLIILNMNGKLVGNFSGEGLNWIHYVCMYKYGDVLLCGLGSHNVLRFSADGKLIGEILKTEGKCQTVYCYRHFTKLLVGFQKKDEIDVYDIT